MVKHYYLFLLFFFAISNIMICQRKVYAEDKVKKLQKVEPANNGRIYITTKFTDSEGIGIFLVNRSTSTIDNFLPNNSNIEFLKEARDKDGNWKEIDAKPKRLTYCYTGSSWVHLKLPPNHYTWNKLHKSTYNGSFETDVRFSYQLPDSKLIVSKPIKVSIDPDLFLPYFERSIRLLDLLILSDTIAKDYRIKLKRKRLQLYYKHSTIEKTIALSEKFVQEHPELEIAKYGLGIHYIRYISKNREVLDKTEIQVLLSKAIGLWEQVNRDNETLFIKAQKRVNYYSSLLLSKEVWLSMRENQYQQILNDYYGSSPFSKEELVKIRFKSN